MTASQRRSLLLAWLGLCASLLFTTHSRAQDRDQQALRVLEETIRVVCPEPKQGGKTRTTELSVEAKAEVSRLIKQLADLGFSAAGKYNNKEWEGILQTELSAQLSEASNCRLTVYRDLRIRLLGAQFQSRSGLVTEQAAPSQRLGSFLITLVKTELSGTTLVATFRVFNEGQQDQSLTLFGKGSRFGYGGSKFYAQNREFLATSAQLGSARSDELLTHKVPSGLALDGTIVFHNIPSDLSRIDSLSIAHSDRNLRPSGAM